MALPTPYQDRSGGVALRRAERLSLVEQFQATQHGRLAAIRESIAHGDAARRIDRGHDLLALAVGRSSQLYQAIQHVRDDDLRELYEAGLAQTFGAAVSRVAEYIRGEL